MDYRLPTEICEDNDGKNLMEKTSLSNINLYSDQAKGKEEL